MKNTFSIMLAAICLAASCSDQEPVSGPDTQDDIMQPLSLSVIAAADVSKSLITGTSLNSGTEIGVSVEDVQGGEYDGVTYSNIRFTAEGNGNTQSWIPDQEIMLSASKANLYAYYPYSDEVTDISHIPVRATSDNQTDYMYADPVSDINNHNPEAAVLLRHALAAVRISLSRGTYTGKGLITGISIEGNSMAISGILDGRNGNLSSLSGTGSAISPSISPVTLSNDAVEFDILAIPTGRQGSINIDITMDGEVFSTETDALTLRQGSVAVIDVSINNSSVTVVPVKVREWTSDISGSASLGKSWSVTIGGDTDGISFNNSIAEDGTVRITASPDFPDAEVNPVTYSGNANVSQHVDESTGTRTIILSDITSDITLGFSSYCLWVTGTYNITSTSDNTRILYLKNSLNQTICSRMKVDGHETDAANFYRFTTTGEHTVKFAFPDKTLIPTYAFYQLENILSLTIPEGVTTINPYSICNCQNLSSVSLPQSLRSGGYDGLSRNPSLKSIILPDNLAMGDNFMSNCTGLESITLPKNLKAIPSNMLYQCSSLKQITIPESVIEIGSNAFRECDLISLTIPNKVSVIPDYMCSSCDNLESISLPSGIRSIGKRAFFLCSSLKHVKIGGAGNEYMLNFPEGITYIGERAFYSCNLMTSIHIPSTLTDIQSAAFNATGMSSVTVSQNNPKYETREGIQGIVEKDTDKLIFGCGTDVIVPESITQIGEYAFSEIPIKSIDLNENITNIENYAFYDTQTLTKVISRATVPPTLGTTKVFANIGKYGVLKVPKNSLDAYKSSAWMTNSYGFLGYSYYNWSITELAAGE